MGIYKGTLKNICVLGLNCYSCPGALGSCPIGSLQAVIADMKFKFSYYVLGFLILIGATLGRVVCGWMCPFGLLGELLYKIPTKKFKVSKIYSIIVICPMFWVNKFGIGKPTFCKYICPVGSLEGGIPLVTLNKTAVFSIGFLYK